MTPLILDEYVRVSRVGKRKLEGEEESDKTGNILISPELQSQKITGYATAHGHELVSNPPEIDVSGSKMERKILDKIIERIRRGETDGIIVAKLNRFARTLIGGLSVIEEIEKAGGSLIAVDGNYDFSTPMGKTVVTILLRLGEMELEQMSEGWSEAQSHAIAKCVWINPHIPPGYDRREDRKLYTNAYSPHIRKAYLMRGSGSSYAAITRYLEKVWPIVDGKPWTSKRVSDIFPKRVYRGELTYGEIKNGEAHEAIVTEAEWQAANNIPKRTVSRGTKNPSLLHGLITCAGCGYTMSPSSVPQRKRKDGTAPPNLLIYTCRRERQRFDAKENFKCPEPSSINRHLADAYIEQAWRESMAGLILAGSTATAALEAADRELVELERELAEFATDTTVRGVLGASRYAQAMETRIEAINAVKERLRALSAQAAVSTPTEATYDELDLEERHDILAGSLDTIICRRAPRGTTPDDRLLILWRGDSPNDIPYPFAWPGVGVPDGVGVAA